MEKSYAEEIAELKEKVARLEDALIKAQSLTTVGELAGTTVHEFNNILTLTINYARMGLRHKDDETREKAFNKILEASNRAAKITNVVLGMARNRSKGLESTDLTAIVEGALLLLERELTKYRVVVEKNFTPVPYVLANGSQIQQVVVNLLVNARQASPNGGRVVVKIKTCEESPEFVELTVRDYGVGIPQEQLPLIFDSFFSTKEGPDESGKGGSGLGLSACKRIIENHKGKIRVESAAGKGSAFIIRLPVCSSEDASA